MYNSVKLFSVTAIIICISLIFGCTPGPGGTNAHIEKTAYPLTNPRPDTNGTESVSQSEFENNMNYLRQGNLKELIGISFGDAANSPGVTPVYPDYEIGWLNPFFIDNPALGDLTLYFDNAISYNEADWNNLSNRTLSFIICDNGNFFGLNVGVDTSKKIYNIFGNPDEFEIKIENDGELFDKEGYVYSTYYFDDIIFSLTLSDILNNNGERTIISVSIRSCIQQFENVRYK